ncbi:hypothetical protein EJA01_01955 [Rhodovulum iodosum]|uniref:uracil-DNA glycosylase family protein n=1 Tax=Rhodovulum iodosum TaxID=68291 RepID=UPI000F66F4D3|nr:hypothetical protein EJA01_01955 [Rhodovulum robiginosum]
MSPCFRIGDVKPEIVVLGSCPGRLEKLDGTPFAGQAGSNLSNLLTELTRENLIGVNDAIYDRYDVTLLNAHCTALWKSEHGRTEPYVREIKVPANLERLRRRLEEVKCRRLVCVGKKAKRAFELVLKEGPIESIETAHLVGHPSQQHLNSHYRHFRPELRLAKMVKNTLRVLPLGK